VRWATTRAAGVAVIALVCLGGALRVWGIGQSLPLVAGRPDESDVLRFTTGFPAGDLNPRWFIYPNLYFYVLWAWEEVVLAVRTLRLPTAGYATLVASGLPSLILYGRWLSAFAGTVTIAAVWAIGRRLRGEALGLAAAAILATDFLHVRDSHTLKPDTLLALGVLASVWLLARWQERSGRGRAVAAGVAIGLTTGIKYPGIVLLAPAWLADATSSRRRGLGRVVPSADLLVLLAAAAVTIAVTNPYLLIDATRTSGTASFATWAVYASRPDAHPPPGASLLVRAATFVRTRAFGYHLGVSLRHGAGLAVALATPVALAHALRGPRRPFLVLAAAFCVVYYLVAGASPVHLARYLTPLLPLVALLVADLACAVTERLPTPGTRTAALTGVVLLLAAEPLAASVAYDRIASRTDTRVLATRWMAEHLPKGAVVAEVGMNILGGLGPELPPGMRHPLPRPGVTDFGALGVTYVVSHEHPVVPFSRPDPAVVATIAPHLVPLAVFTPFRDGPAGAFETEDAYYVPFYGFRGIERPGPIVRVYAYRP
jgi:hypothetical protein